MQHGRSGIGQEPIKGSGTGIATVVSSGPGRYQMANISVFSTVEKTKVFVREAYLYGSSASVEGPGSVP